MDKLIQGIHKFKQKALGRYQALFHRLSREGQNPHTLFITCCDSRVIAELITQSQPGDLFVVKNIGNIVPPSSETRNSTGAAIEFAVALGVSDVVVCGHSLCGAMATLIEGPPQGGKTGHLREWLSLADPVRAIMDQHYNHLSGFEERTSAAAQENVLFALENLQTYPIVTSKLAEGKLRLHGWFFEIATAQMFAYDPDTEQFQPIQSS